MNKQLFFTQIPDMEIDDILDYELIRKRAGEEAITRIECLYLMTKEDFQVIISSIVNSSIIEDKYVKGATEIEYKEHTFFVLETLHGPFPHTCFKLNNHSYMKVFNCSHGSSIKVGKTVAELKNNELNAVAKMMVEPILTIDWPYCDYHYAKVLN